MQGVKPKFALLFSTLLLIASLMLNVNAYLLIQTRDKIDNTGGYYYTGNPFTTELWSGQLQAENITGMHWYTYIGGSLYNRTDVIAYPEQAASYVVFTDGSYFYAKNCSTGQIEFSGEDAATVIQDAVDRAPSYGTVKVTGSISYDTTLQLKDYLTFTFEYLYYTGTGYAIENPNKATSSIQAVNIIGNTLSTADSGIDFNGVQKSTININRILGNDTVGSIGLRLGHGGTGIPSWWNTVYINEIRNFDTNVKTIDGANAIRLEIMRSRDAITYGINLDEGKQITGFIGDANAGGTAYVRVNTEFWGYVRTEGAGNPSVARLHIDAGATDYYIIYKSYSAGNNLQVDSFDGVLIYDSGGWTQLRGGENRGALGFRVYAPSHRFKFFDDFFGTSLTAGWNTVTVGTGSVSLGGINGYVTLSTGGTTGGNATLNQNAVRSFKITAALDPYMALYAGVTATTQETVRFGFYRNANNNAMFYYDSGETAGNWTCRCTDGGSLTEVDSGVAVDTSLHLFEIDASSSEVKFYIDGSLVATITDDIYTGGGQDVEAYISTKEDATKSLRIDWIEISQNRE